MACLFSWPATALPALKKAGMGFAISAEISDLGPVGELRAEWSHPGGKALEGGFPRNCCPTESKQQSAPCSPSHCLLLSAILFLTIGDCAKKNKDVNGLE